MRLAETKHKIYSLTASSKGKSKFQDSASLAEQSVSPYVMMGITSLSLLIIGTGFS